MNKATQIISWLLSIAIVVILIQTLFFKFTAAPESVYIFEKTGLGDFGRIGSGVVELIASILLLIPRTVWLGALMSMGTMAGAILFHLTSLGIEVMEDGGTLFYMAVGVFIGSAIVLYLHRKEVPLLNKIKRAN